MVNLRALIGTTEIYRKSGIKIATEIVKEESHPLHIELSLTHSGRRQCLWTMRTSRFNIAFVPSAIIMLNDNHIVIHLS